MKRIALYAIVAAALIAAPAVTRAQDNPGGQSGSTEATAPAAKKRKLPFHGKVAAVEAKAMTIKVGKMILHITPETKITKDGKPAIFADISVGEVVHGSYKKDAEGKLNATLIRIGPKTENKKAPTE